MSPFFGQNLHPKITHNFDAIKGKENVSMDEYILLHKIGIRMSKIVSLQAMQCGRNHNEY